MPVAYLVGNGINRAGGAGPTWKQILVDLATDAGVKVSSLLSAPFPLVYHELVRANEPLGRRSRELRGRVSDYVKKLQTSSLHLALMKRGPGHVLTTNYDHALESSLGSVGHPVPWERSKKYSLFRNRMASNVRVWHVHGDVEPARSIMLGYDHYVGSLQRIRSYLKTEYLGGSQFKRGVRRFEKSAARYSWVDVFLRDDVHIIGLTLDYAEIDLWWLLTYKDHLRRHRTRVGQTIYWAMDDGRLSVADYGRHRMLKALGVEVRVRPVARHANCQKTWQKTWEKLISELPAR